jgi:hypothetical protein
MPKDQVEQFLLLSLEHERGAAGVYHAALLCAVDESLRQEWRTYLADTLEHANILEEVCSAMGLDPERQFPMRGVVRKLGAAFVEAIWSAREQGSPEAAQLVACECVVLVETKDRLDWDLLGHVAKAIDGEAAEGLREACDIVEDQEDEHLSCSLSRCRDLWLQCLGIDPVLPLAASDEIATPIVDAGAPCKPRTRRCEGAPGRLTRKHEEIP